MSQERLTVQASHDLATDFFKRLDAGMASYLFGPQKVVLSVLDYLYELFTETENNSGYVVQNAWENGNEIDLIHGTTKIFWDSVIFDEDLRSGNNISFFDLENSRQSFLITLGTQLLINLPTSPEEVRVHVKRQIASVFNGANFYRVRFRLIYIDYNVFDGEYLESHNLADMLVA